VVDGIIAGGRRVVEDAFVGLYRRKHAEDGTPIVSPTMTTVGQRRLRLGRRAIGWDRT
jgi:hypothetical protein